jgi:hypothetical protein
VELPGRQRTLTLAEVEVMSDGVNIARKGKASQSSVSNGGEPSRAIDGNRSGEYGSGSQTHTQEGTINPWWELDLGGEFPIDTVVVYNRTDGNLGGRLSNHTIKVLDSARKVLFEKAGLPAPAVSAKVDVGGESPDRALRAETMLALVAVRGQEEKTFTLLADRVKADKDRLQAVRALSRLPRAAWSRAEAPALANIVLGVIKRIPANERTGPAAIDYVEFADGLAGLLPAEKSRALRRDLGELAVRVIRLGTLPERMAYDKELLVVQAGKPLEIVLGNGNLSPILTRSCFPAGFCKHVNRSNSRSRRPRRPGFTRMCAPIRGTGAACTVPFMLLLILMPIWPTRKRIWRKTRCLPPTRC